ncbi:hypothetical protein P153DRAFT_401660 [Dothidotthia symphoricarpi CBS 119687]|uniref:Uncharacterized protein n=1 Tax=Dothidotthia symphoricarpi CBS 119687 TaxID=1392245 RepID=A0A6A5ZXK9_9PLEO|nr:uncharacterized protein P153DRAFT_401660 [Dothidotthia symphoricarpi CBS 119687]KAF2123755.1 hypothetical protein P153DRAFT_401660 [Dothidotthia symphoricarpi CBS 119687]
MGLCRNARPFPTPSLCRTPLLGPLRLCNANPPFLFAHYSLPSILKLPHRRLSSSMVYVYRSRLFLNLNVFSLVLAQSPAAFPSDVTSPQGFFGGCRKRIYADCQATSLAQCPLTERTLDTHHEQPSTPQPSQECSVLLSFRACPA